MKENNVSESKGRSETIYFNAEEIEKIDNKANELGISIKELIKPRCLSDDGHILIQKRMNFDKEIYNNLKVIGEAMAEIDCFYNSLDSASNELQVHKDINFMTSHHYHAMGIFKSTLDVMRKTCINNAC